MNIAVTQPLPAPMDTAAGSSWEARLSLRIARRANGTRLVEAEHQGPLTVQRPFYPEGEDWPHIYLLHPPGGLVSGDSLHIAATVDRDARALITTPGAGRAYGARRLNPQQRQFASVRVDADACLEWFPMENILYPGAQLMADTHIELAAGARFAGWEINCLGLPASRAPFRHGSLKQSLSIRCEGQWRFIDRLTIEAPSPLQHAAAGLAGNTVSGVLVAGPFADTFADIFAETRDSEDIAEGEVNRLRDLPAQGNAARGIAITRLGAFVIARYLGHSAFDARRQFAALWAGLRPALMGRPACAPRIWTT